MAHEDQKSLFKRIVCWAIFFIILIAIVTGVIIWHKPQVLPIKTIEVQGVPKRFQAQVEGVIKPCITAGLLSQPLNPMITQLIHLPWISSVIVQRRWPDSLNIKIQQQRVIAAWNDDSLLNRYGEVLPVRGFPVKNATLPDYYGPAGTQIEVVDYAQRFNRILLPLQLSAPKVVLRKDNGWQIFLSNGIKVALGQQDVLTRLERFVKVYSKVFSDPNKSAKAVDLQYPNGMAIEWGQ